MSKIRNCLNDDTIDALLFLRHYYSKYTLFILQYNRLLYCFVNPEKSRDYVMEIPGENSEPGISHLVPKSHPYLYVNNIFATSRYGVSFYHF